MTLAGVDIYSWHLCADQEVRAGDWYQGGGSNRLGWTETNCRQDSLAVAATST